MLDKRPNRQDPELVAGNLQARLVVDGLEETLGQRLAVHKLLCNKASNADHGKAAIVELLGLDVVLLSWVIGVQAKGVEAKGSWLVLILHMSM